MTTMSSLRQQPVAGPSRPMEGPASSAVLPDGPKAPSLPGSSEGGLRATLSGMLEQNPYFSAGFGLMGVGVALTALRRSAVLAGTLAQRRMLVTLEISAKDKSYLWFLNWMSHNATSSNRARLLAPRSHELSLETSYEQRQDGPGDVTFSLVPGPGRHYFRYAGAWFQAKRERTGSTVNVQTGTPWETVTITTLSRDRHLFPRLLAEARDLAQRQVEGRTVIYTAWSNGWQPFGRPRQRRALDSVILRPGQSDRIRADVEEFMSRARWYSERGIPYRRGYLFHGPPGSGKSSFIMALAGEIGHSICALNLSERGMTDDKLNHLLANVPERSLILLEDVDAAFVGRTAGEMRSNVTFSGLLNAIDGVASSTDQRVLLMTTNHLSRLDPALVRPGRVDLVELFDDASPSQAGELFRRFYRGHAALATEADLEGMRTAVEQTVGRAFEEGRVGSMAALQGLFIRAASPGEAVRDLDEILQPPRPPPERLVPASAASF